jgi:hypothetical protein
MMIEYKIYEQDFLDFQLFAATQSENMKRKKRNGWLFLTIGCALVALYFVFQQDMVMSVYMALVAAIWGVFYPKYHCWIYKRHYKNYIKEHFNKRFGQTEIIEISQDGLYSKNKTGEGKINLSEIVEIDETARHFFIKISNGNYLIIPKQEIANAEELRAQFQSLGLNVINMVDWKWR